MNQLFHLGLCQCSFGGCPVPAGFRAGSTLSSAQGDAHRAAVRAVETVDAAPVSYSD